MILNVIISGQATNKKVRQSTPIHEAVAAWLAEHGQSVPAPREWELRTYEGELIGQGRTFKAANVSDGDSLFLDPGAGVGG